MSVSYDWSDIDRCGDEGGGVERMSILGLDKSSCLMVLGFLLVIVNFGPYN